MRLLSLIGVLAILVGIAALVFFFGGFFNVSARNEEPAPVKWALIKVRMAAVDRYATDNPPSGYDAQDKVQAGAKAYSARGCTNCHNGPDVEWQAFGELLPLDTGAAVAIRAAARHVGLRAGLDLRLGVVTRRRPVGRVAVDRGHAHLDQRP